MGLGAPAPPRPVDRPADAPAPAETWSGPPTGLAEPGLGKPEPVPGEPGFGAERTEAVRAAAPGLAEAEPDVAGAERTEAVRADSVPSARTAEGGLELLDRGQPSTPRRRRSTEDDSKAERRPATAPASDNGAAAAKTRSGRRRKKENLWREIPMLLLVALLLTSLIQTFLARVYEIPSGSMEKTLHGCTGCTNDRVMVDKLSYRFGDPSPGDVVVFEGPPSWKDEDDTESSRSSNPVVSALQSAGSLIGLAAPDEKDLIKRVIAVGGQTVACCDAQNRVTVDGKPLAEPYIYYVPTRPVGQQSFGPVKVPEGFLWVMGDSRNNSKDSRWPGHGAIPIGNVIGKARFVVLPFSRVKSIPDPNPQRVVLAAPPLERPPPSGK